ncbi:MAG TPA: dockerin type I domain-containing protein [Chthoniobacterales bacterium]|nr:dockerin type I domain-containing protein [Chthoniobacterales bacterium]
MKKKKSRREAAFFYARGVIGLLLCVFSLVFVFLAFRSTSAQNKSQAPTIAAQYRGVLPVVHFDVSPPLREIPVIPPGLGELRENEDRDIVPRSTHFAPQTDPVVQAITGGREVAGPIVSFDGQPNASGVAPPDPNGSVGPNHVVTMANLSFQIFTKTGSSVYGPAASNTLWTGFGGLCEIENAGDPVVVYDHLADRWFLSQFTSQGPVYYFCVAVSTSPDPTGTYYRYAISTGINFPDYPKASVWPDAYYISTREFPPQGGFAGVGAYALNRAEAIAGNPNATIISFLAPPTPAYVVGDGLLPSDLDGPNLPPPGSPNYFLGSMDNNGPYGAPQDALLLWKFTADFNTPANSTFVLANTIPVASFNSDLGLCAGGRACIPQPNTTNRIDHLGIRQRPLFRLAYRNFGTHESLVTNQSVSAGTGPAGEISGIRWWELRSPNSNPVVYQEGTFAPGLTDGVHRWMGSIAMDGEGNMALAYSSSSSTRFPSVSYTGRFASSPLGTMPLGEGTIVAGTGSQTGGGNRWGDYTSLSVDPSDDLTFWHTNEYVPSTSASGWRVRVGSFKISASPANLIGNGGSAVVSAGPNGVLDPGETVTVSLGARNFGGPGAICTTAALAGTLQAGSGVTAPSAAQTYGVLCSNGTAGFRDFTFTVDPSLPCGSTVTASLKMLDGTTDYGTLTYTFTIGSLVPSNIENFDNVTAPALPAGWSTISLGFGAPVVTSTTFPDTAPNDIFLVNANNVGLSEVTSAPIAIPAGGAKLNFRNLFNTEAGYDGMVLEISIPTVLGGAFQDILDAGGSFNSGGYNATLAQGPNVLTTRQAWSGLSAGSESAPGYITTSVNLPAAANGQTIQLKWRLGSDNTIAPAVNPGARIDTITLGVPVCGGSAPSVISAVSRKVHPGAGTFDVPLPLVGVNGAVGIEPRTEATPGVHTMVVSFANPVTVGDAKVTTGTGTASASVAGSVVKIDLTGVTNAQRIGVTLSNVNDGTRVGSILVPMGVLLGDVTGNGTVSNTDVSNVKGQVSAPVTSSNFRHDVTANGAISNTDVSTTKAQVDTVLP